MNFFKNTKIKILLIIIFITACFFIQIKPSFSQNDENELFLVAQKAFDDGFYDVAIRYIEQFLAQFPESKKHVQSKILLGQCYFFKNQYLKAYDIFQNLVKDSSYKDITLYWLGETLLKGSDYNQAKKHYTQLIDTYPNSLYAPQACYSLGWLFFEQEEFQNAKNTLLGLIEKFPDHQLSEDAYFKIGECEYNLKNFEQTIEYFNKYISKYPKTPRLAESYFYIAESYYYSEDPLRANTFYAKVVELSYDNKLILMSKISMGWGYLKLEKYNLSQEYFQNALKFAREKGLACDEIYFGLGSLFTQTNDHEKALKSYSEIIDEFPDSIRNSDAYLGKANSFYLLDDFTQSVRTYRTIIDKLTGTKGNEEILEKAYFGLAWSYLKAGNVFLAVKNFETIKDQSADKNVKISALTQIGDAYQDVDQLDKAVETYDEILKNYAENPYADYVQYRLGIALLKMNKVDSATLAFQALKANFPESKYLSDIKYYLSIAYFKKGDWKSAKEQSESFIKSAEGASELTAEASFILALSYFNLSEHKNAINEFMKIIKNYPNETAMVKTSELSIAKCSYELGNIKDAINKFNHIIKIYPQSVEAQESLMSLGYHYLRTSNFSNAINTYNVFLERFPGHKKLNAVQFDLGQAYIAMEEYDKAISVLKKVYDKNNAELTAKAKLTIAEIFSKKLDETKAIETYQNVIETSPEYKRDAYSELAKLYKNKKDYQASLDIYKNAVNSKKGMSSISDAELRFHLADNYELLNDYKFALEEYFKIPYLHANDKSWSIKAYLRIARIFSFEEKWEEAKKIYNKIIEYKTDEAKFAQERLEWIAENIKE